MNQIHKMLKKHIGKLFIITSKLCSSKQTPKSTSNVFKLIYSQIENFHKKPKCFSNYNLSSGYYKIQIPCSIAE